MNQGANYVMGTPFLAMFIISFPSRALA